MTTAAATVRQICSLVKRFEFKELEAAVMPNFPEISWSHVRTELVKKHKSFTVNNALGLIEPAIREANIPEKVLKARLSSLEVIDISRHHRRKIWYGYALTGTSSTMDHVSLKEQKKKARVQRAIPVFFALFLGQKYFFCSKKNVSMSFVRAITSSLGYKSSRKIKLNGRDLGSLSKLCWRRKQGALNPENIDKPPIYRDAAPVIKNAGIDFTQYKQRRAYADKLFGDEPPTLESLVVNGPDLPWTSKDISSKLQDERMHVTWEFRSHNIPTCLTKLIERRVIATPVPDYISNFMTAGRNEFTVRSE